MRSTKRSGSRRRTRTRYQASSARSTTRAGSWPLEYSLDSPAHPGPVGLAELPLQELAGRVARQVVPEIDVARFLVTGQQLIANRGQLVRRLTHAWPRDGGSTRPAMSCGP